MTILRRHHGFLLAMGWMGSACSNPQWDHERQHVTGVFAGESCTLAWNGVDFRRAAVQRPRVDILSETAQYDLALIDCGGLDIQVQTPLGTLPAAGTYPVIDTPTTAPALGTVAAGVDDARISAGRWPFAIKGMVRFIGTSGTVWIDSMTRKAVYGRFAIVGRRAARGID